MVPYVVNMLVHVLNSHFTHLFQYDDQLPLMDGQGYISRSVGITLLDLLGVLALVGLHRTFPLAALWVEVHLTLTMQDVAESALVVNIHIIGRLLAAHHVYENGVAPVVRGEHEYAGGLLRIVRELGERLMRVFDSPTGLPFSSITVRRWSGVRGSWRR